MAQALIHLLGDPFINECRADTFTAYIAWQTLRSYSDANISRAVWNFAATPKLALYQPPHSVNQYHVRKTRLPIRLTLSESSSLETASSANESPSSFHAFRLYL
jgi:hypothetical protein